MPKRKESTITNSKSIYDVKPFFENNHYTLWKDKVLIENDTRPKLMLLRNRRGYIYIAYNYGYNFKSVTSYWPIASIDPYTLKALLKNKKAIADVFKSSKEIYESTIDFEANAESYKLIASDQLQEKCLPEKDKYLDCNPSEYRSYINAVKDEFAQDDN